MWIPPVSDPLMKFMQIPGSALKVYWILAVVQMAADRFKVLLPGKVLP